MWRGIYHLFFHRGIPKSCYWNSQQLLKKHPEWIYCEGYALAPGIPIPLRHGWLIDRQKSILEPTWDANDSVYIEVTFSTRWFKSLLDDRRAKNRDDEISVFEGNYLEQYSLLKQGLPLECYSEITWN